ncbi:MAG: glycosyltransferase family 39 protein [bacterium]|nr:glycosyltransferase family 39 protein [bacterium]
MSDQADKPGYENRRMKLYTACLIVIVVMGAFLRFRGIADKGLYQHDEADFMLRVRSYATLFQALPQIIAGNVTDLRSWSYDVFASGFFPSTSALPTFLIPASIFAAIVGDYDWILPAMNATLGVLTIFIVYLLARRLSGNAYAGLLGAVFVALSPYHVLYSRMGFAQFPAGFFFTLAVYLYVESFFCDERVRYRYLFGVGLALGAMVSSHYGTLPVLALFGLCELYMGLRVFRDMYWGRWGVMAFGVLAPLLFWQAVLWARAQVLWHAGFDRGKVTSYFGEVYGMALAIVNSDADAIREGRPLDPFFYASIVQDQHGALFLAAFFATPLLLWIAWRRRNMAMGAVALLVWMPAVYFSLLRYQVSRILAIFLPLTFIMVAVLLATAIARWLPKRMVMPIYAGLILLVMYTWLPKALDATHIRSTYSEAAAQLKEFSQDYAVSATPYTMYQYYGTMRLDAVDKALAEGRSVVYAIDHLRFNDPAALALEAAQQPLIEMPNNLGTSYPFLLDNFPSLTHVQVRQLMETRPDLTTVRFYRLEPKH